MIYPTRSKSKLFLALITGALVSSSICFAGTKIIESGKRKPASGSDEFLAATIFMNYVKCGRAENSSPELVEKCVARYFSPSVSEGVVRGYIQTLRFPNEYSEPFYCDKETVERVKRFDETPFDVILCFESNILGEKETKVSSVLFKRSGGQPLIVRIRL